MVLIPYFIPLFMCISDRTIFCRCLSKSSSLTMVAKVTTYSFAHFTSLSCPVVEIDWYLLSPVRNLASSLFRPRCNAFGIQRGFLFRCKNCTSPSCTVIGTSIFSSMISHLGFFGCLPLRPVIIPPLHKRAPLRVHGTWIWSIVLHGVQLTWTNRSIWKLHLIDRLRFPGRFNLSVHLLASVVLGILIGSGKYNGNRHLVMALSWASQCGNQQEMEV